MWMPETGQVPEEEGARDGWVLGTGQYQGPVKEASTEPSVLKLMISTSWSIVTDLMRSWEPQDSHRWREWGSPYPLQQKFTRENALGF